MNEALCSGKAQRETDYTTIRQVSTPKRQRRAWICTPESLARSGTLVAQDLTEKPIALGNGTLLFARVHLASSNHRHRLFRPSHCQQAFLPHLVLLMTRRIARSERFRLGTCKSYDINRILNRPCSKHSQGVAKNSLPCWVISTCYNSGSQNSDRVVTMMLII